MSEFKSSAAKIELTSYEELFGDVSTDDFSGKVYLIPISEIKEFKDHPFKVIDDDKMDELVESIKEYGVLTPGVVRRLPDGSYEMISGHRRKHALKLLGIEFMPVVVREYEDDEAAIAMVDANIQREEVLPSEKARAYRIRYDAIKHQGKKGNALNVMSEDTGENTKKIQRYIWLSRLNDDLLSMVDFKKLGLSQGITLSFLKPEEQLWVLNAIRNLSINMSTKQSEELKDLSQSNILDEAEVWRVLSPMTDVDRKNRKVTMKGDVLDDYFSDEYSVEQIKDIIIKLLDDWKKREGEL